MVGSHERRVDHQRIDDQDEGRVIESPHHAAYESFCEIHGYGNQTCGYLARSLVCWGGGPSCVIDRMCGEMFSKCLKE